LSFKSLIVWCFALAALGTYLFVSAPPPLEEKPKRGTIPIEKALAMINAQNEDARALYAEHIVGEGLKQGLRFDEKWKKSDVHAGPLPALFLRETAFYLEAHPTRLSLFLGSHRPINQANAFVGAQVEAFEQIEETRRPETFYSRDTDLYVAMFPDVASSEACASCHNEHPDSPKRNWSVGDVMGATTWSHPSSHVTVEEVLEMSDALLGGIERAYGLVLDELSRLPRKPRIGSQWPSDGYALPSQTVFMREVRGRTAPKLLQALSDEVRKHEHASR
jgi:hypothetical protein